jgi:hypothetical protein
MTRFYTLPQHLHSRISKEISPKTALNEKKNKYNVASKENRIQDNITFSSKKEKERYSQLKMLEKSNAISNLILQPSFLLQDRFTDSTGKKHRAIHYVADFQYNIKDLIFVEDVKPSKTFSTDVYKIKKKLFLFKYPDLNFREVY